MDSSKNLIEGTVKRDQPTPYVTYDRDLNRNFPRILYGCQEKLPSRASMLSRIEYFTVLQAAYDEIETRLRDQVDLENAESF
jgi:hypothetical protein